MESRRLADIDEEREQMTADDQHHSHTAPSPTAPHSIQDLDAVRCSIKDLDAAPHSIQVLDAAPHGIQDLDAVRCSINDLDAVSCIIKDLDAAPHSIQVLEPAVHTDACHERRRSLAAERAVSRSFIVRDCRRYSLVSRRGTVSHQLCITFKFIVLYYV